MTEDRELTAGEIMTVDVLTVTEHHKLWDAWTMMTNSQVRHLIITADTHVIGIIDDRKLIAEWPQTPWALMTTSLRTLLGERVTCVLPNCRVSQVAKIMNQDRVDAVAVVDKHGVLVGLVTAGDIVHAVAERGVHIPQDIPLGPP